MCQSGGHRAFGCSRHPRQPAAKAKPEAAAPALHTAVRTHAPTDRTTYVRRGLRAPHHLRALRAECVLRDSPSLHFTPFHTLPGRQSPSALVTRRPLSHESAQGCSSLGGTWAGTVVASRSREGPLVDSQQENRDLSPLMMKKILAAPGMS